MAGPLQLYYLTGELDAGTSYVTFEYSARERTAFILLKLTTVPIGTTFRVVQSNNGIDWSPLEIDGVFLEHTTAAASETISFDTDLYTANYIGFEVVNAGAGGLYNSWLKVK